MRWSSGRARSVLRELVELAVTVATANATTRICNALKVEAD
jgi:hypothetical protein